MFPLIPSLFVVLMWPKDAHRLWQSTITSLNEWIFLRQRVHVNKSELNIVDTLTFLTCIFQASNSSLEEKLPENISYKTNSVIASFFPINVDPSLRLFLIYFNRSSCNVRLIVHKTTGIDRSENTEMDSGKHVQEKRLIDFTSQLYTTANNQVSNPFMFFS